MSVVGVNLNPAFPYPMGLALLRSLTLSATLAAIPATWPTLVPLLDSGRLTPDAVFTHRLGLSEAPHAYQIFESPPGRRAQGPARPKGGATSRASPWLGGRPSGWSGVRLTRPARRRGRRPRAGRPARGPVAA